MRLTLSNRLSARSTDKIVDVENKEWCDVLRIAPHDKRLPYPAHWNEKLITDFLNGRKPPAQIIVINYSVDAVILATLKLLARNTGIEMRQTHPVFINLNGSVGRKTGRYYFYLSYNLRYFTSARNDIVPPLPRLHPAVSSASLFLSQLRFAPSEISIRRCFRYKRSPK